METISTEYRKLLEAEHSENVWGKTAEFMTAPIRKYLNRMETTKFLDYGAGHGGLRKTIGHIYDITEYEPGRPEVSNPPEPHDYVVCIDVLEHVEPDLLDNVLKDLQRVTRKGGLFQIATRPARKILKDGRNAHLIVEDADWWLKKLSKYFTLADAQIRTGIDVRVEVCAISACNAT